MSATTRIRLDKRWRAGRSSWVTPDACFSPDGYVVDGTNERAAKQFTCEHHYAGTFPAARLAVGLYGRGAKLVGLAVFSVPMNQQVIPSRSGFAPDAGVELGRFVCLPDVLFNGESWFLARAFRIAREALGVRAVVSYADPLERHTAAGEIYKRAHWGTIYQATNALYVGRSSPRWLVIGPTGQVVSGRALSKIRRGEKGEDYASEQLLSAGAPPRRRGESGAQWVLRATNSGGFRRVRHEGNLCYVFGLDRAARDTIRATNDGGLPYLRRAA